MTINLTQENGICIVAVDGSLDSSKSAVFEQQVNQALADGNQAILVDFSDLDYTSSAGLRVLLSTAQKLKASGGKFALCGLNDNVKEVFELSGLDSILKIFPKREEAVTAGLK